MSRRGSVIAAVVAALALALPALCVPVSGAAAAPSAKRRCATAKHASRAARRRRAASCRRAVRTKPPASPKPKPSPSPLPRPAPATPQSEPPPPGHPVTMTVLDGSNVTLDLGMGVIRTFPLSGTLQGYIDGEFVPGAATTFELNRGSLAVGPTDVLVDACPSPAISHTNPATSVSLDPARPTQVVLGAGGDVLMTSHVIIRVVLDLRGASPCGGPTSVSGYADTAGTVPLTGHTTSDAAGLSGFTLASHKYPLVLRECWIPGDPAQPCMLAPTGLLSTATTDLKVSVVIG